MARARARARTRPAASAESPRRRNRSARVGGQQVVVGELAPLGELVDQREPAIEVAGHRHRDGPVEPHDGRGHRQLERVIQRGDPAPFDVWLDVAAGDLGLETVGADCGIGSRPPAPTNPTIGEQRFGLRDLIVMPAAAVLILERDQVAARVDARVAAGVLQQHQRQQCVGLRLLRHQLPRAGGRGGSPRRRGRRGSAHRPRTPSSPR